MFFPSFVFTKHLGFVCIAFLGQNQDAAAAQILAGVGMRNREFNFNGFSQSENRY
jgi:hypothetical protein